MSLASILKVIFHIRSLSFDEWLCVSTLLMYRMNDLKPEMEIQKYDWTTRLGSRRVEDGKGLNLNTILIKLKCENTQHKMDCI